MDSKSALFYIFSLVLVFSGFRVITARNPVHAALFLVLAFFSAACVWMLLRAEFLAITLVLVYVGAVMVLFLFVVMMLDINLDQMRAGFWKVFPVAATVGVVIVLEIALVVFNSFSGVQSPADALKGDNTKLLGALLYGSYVYPAQVAAVVLLVAIIAAIALTLRRRKDVRYVSPSEQVRVRRQDRVRLVRMPPQGVAPGGAAAQGKEAS
jgi:NADH-quinone oxidoreductase subunit J